jgi:hypothetical protein
MLCMSRGQSDHENVEIMREAFYQHGWILLREYLPATIIDAAYDSLSQLYPTADQYFADPSNRENSRFNASRVRSELHPDDDELTSGPAYRRAQFAGVEDFPFTSSELNRIVLDPSIIGLARDLLGCDNPMLYQAVAFAKYFRATNYEQPMHVDYYTHTITAPRQRDQIEFFVYLHDVSADLAPPRFVSREASHHRPLVPYYLLPSQAPELYAAETSTPAGRGSVIVYGPDVWHRAVDLDRPGGARFVLNFSYKNPERPWVGFQSFARGSLRPAWNALIAISTPEMLIALGFPAPGHPWWTEEALNTVQLRYPTLDLRLWHKAMHR